MYKKLRQINQLPFALYIKALGILVFGFLLGYLFSLSHYSLNKTRQTSKTPLYTGEQYKTTISEGNNSFQLSFTYPSEYRISKSYVSRNDNQELTLSASKNTDINFTVDILKADKESAVRTWSQGYSKTHILTFNNKAWIYFSSKDCNTQQACSSNDIWFLSGTKKYQVLFHFLDVKEITQAQKNILSSVTLREISL